MGELAEEQIETNIRQAINFPFSQATGGDAMTTGFQFKTAQRKAAKLRLALCSPAGGGKTYSALKIAKGIGGKVAMIDTEHGSGSLYADLMEYAVLELDSPFTPRRYIEAMETAEKAGFDIIIVDSLTHAWAGEGGILDMHDKATSASRSGNSFASWREVTPEHNRLVDALLQSKSHIIATMRTKAEYTQSTDEKGKTVVKKVGMAPIQREGIDYEFTVVLDLTTDHIATSSKDRTSLFDGQHFKPDEATGQKLLTWLNSGKPVQASGVTDPSQAQSTPGKPTPDAIKSETKIPGESQAEKEFDAIPSASQQKPATPKKAPPVTNEETEAFIAWLKANNLTGQMIKDKMNMTWMECLADIPAAKTKIKVAFALKE